MKAWRSLLGCAIIAVALLGYRSWYSDIGGQRKNLVITQWDAFGYYLYLPATIIYHDYKKLSWAEGIDKRYNVSGGGALPLISQENGNRVSKYFCGDAILQAPFFLIGHLVAKAGHFADDGFSPPYQYALAFGVVLYCILALFLLRHILLRYFSDATVAVTLLLLCLATNLIQYTSIDNGLSHAWIFPLYVLLLYTTIRWHERPRVLWAILTGLIIGLATICRPTELIAFLIPLLWGLQDKASSKAKWALVRANKRHVVLALLSALIGILPQLQYWKAVTGTFIYDVGSKWVFLNPWWRVLFGWEKGWFIYTPVTVLFIAGLFFLKKFPFSRAVLVFCLLNIWIIISWDEWQYGASYATRALVQSYPVFAFPLAAVTERLLRRKWKPVLALAGFYLIALNLFQLWQYNTGILHYSDMNRRYYGRIYLNPHPTPLDMSLMDTDEWLGDEQHYHTAEYYMPDTPKHLHFAANNKGMLLDTGLSALCGPQVSWLRISAHLRAPGKLWQSHLAAALVQQDSVRRSAVRLYNPVGEKTGNYAFWFRIPEQMQGARLQIYLASEFDFEGTVDRLEITTYKD